MSGYAGEVGPGVAFRSKKLSSSRSRSPSESCSARIYSALRRDPGTLKCSRRCPDAVPPTVPTWPADSRGGRSHMIGGGAGEVKIPALNVAEDATFADGAPRLPFESDRFDDHLIPRFIVHEIEIGFSLQKNEPRMAFVKGLLQEFERVRLVAEMGIGSADSRSGDTYLFCAEAVRWSEKSPLGDRNFSILREDFLCGRCFLRLPINPVRCFQLLLRFFPHPFFR